MTNEEVMLRMAELAHQAAGLRPDDPALQRLLAEMEALAALLPPATEPEIDEDAEAQFDNMPV
ncbi:MAG: hypothetical protein ACK4KW_14800 [Gemmobacter sp.]